MKDSRVTVYAALGANLVDIGVWEGIKRAKDPTTFVVVLEDSAALIGIPSTL